MRYQLPELLYSSSCVMTPAFCVLEWTAQVHQRLIILYENKRKTVNHQFKMISRVEGCKFSRRIEEENRKKPFRLPRHTRRVVSNQNLYQSLQPLTTMTEMEKLNTTLSGLMITAKQIDKRTYVRYNVCIATLGLSYGTVQRNGR